MTAADLPMDAVLVDIRDALDAAAAPLEQFTGARAIVHAPLHDLEEGLVPDIDVTAPLVVVCGTGSRSELAGAYLLAAGFEEVSLLEGGVRAWRRSLTASEGE